MKLKTLKDIKSRLRVEEKPKYGVNSLLATKEIREVHNNLLDELFVDKRDLRKELGIKYIKELESIREDYKPQESDEKLKRFCKMFGLGYPEIISDDYHSCEAIDLIIVVLKHIFNIKEEDLK